LGAIPRRGIYLFSQQRTRHEGTHHNALGKHLPLRAAIVSKKILEKHLKHCVASPIRSHDVESIDQKLDEIMIIIKRVEKQP